MNQPFRIFNFYQLILIMFRFRHTWKVVSLSETHFDKFTFPAADYPLCDRDIEAVHR